MAVKRALARRAGIAARRLRAERLSMPEKTRRIRAFSAEFVVESENLEGASITRADLLDGK
jgi:hypothetical protein